MKQKTFLTIMAVILTIQSVLDAFNAVALPEKVKTIIGAVTIVVGLITVGLNQFLNPQTSNKSLWLSLSLFVAFIAGGILDKLHVFNIPDSAQGYVRLGLTLVVAIVGAISRTAFPSGYTPSK